jgi:hypothetical protein
MRSAFVKMMTRISEIENYILKGLVLDEHGKWIPIADKKAVEEDFLAHLMAGQVLHEGRWVSIGEAKSAKAPTEIAMTDMEMPLIDTCDTDAQNPVEETRVGVPEKPFAPPAHSSVEFPPETKSIIIEHLASSIAGSAVDPVSGYAPETGAFTLETSNDKTAAALPEDQSKAPETAGDGILSPTAASSLLPTVTSWEQSARKRQRTILIYGTLGVILAGIGAIVILIVQLAR